MLLPRALLAQAGCLPGWGAVVAQPGVVQCGWRAAAEARRRLHCSGAAAAADDDAAAADAAADAESAEQPASSSGGGDDADAAAPGARRWRARHMSLDDPELNIYLRHNTELVTDPDRSYAIGQAQALERKTRQELRKALAAQRLHLADAAAAAAAGPAGGAKQLPMREQMLAALAAMREHAGGGGR
ncbi:hypothetical protein HT031_003944 [Scenedesmus sp. PABB004]|nr:hypothetical protein HT031_003944 [Scenedesmus sp. PABB004]